GIQQGSAISPLLANLFLHIALDSWLKRTYPSLPFERFADDWLGHCHTEDEAKQILTSIQTRLQKCGLTLNQEKTKIVYCQDDNRRNHHQHESFDFLGFTFRSRCAKSNAGKVFRSFSPAIANKASKEIRQTIRQWRIHRRTVETLNSLSRLLTPVIRGWIEYYGKYYRSEIYQVLRRIDAYLIRWVCQKYKSFRRQPKRAKQWLWKVKLREPTLFAHWVMTAVNGNTVIHEGSRMS
ncbi:MAG: reverse transcriptase domain-containing protein, partial [Candidatus Cloacimonadaceae bacterium]|nr:reverse transcriptase domain-containing protein [Candidatus Cloacimonadaceae bacterium]